MVSRYHLDLNSSVACGRSRDAGTHYYIYDDENRVIAVDSGGTATYGYNADGQRSHKNRRKNGGVAQV